VARTGDGSTATPNPEAPRQERPDETEATAKATPAAVAATADKDGPQKREMAAIPANPPSSPAPAEAGFPPIYSAEQRETMTFLERVLVPLNRGAVTEALGQSKASNLPISKHISSVLERAQQLRRAGIENLRKNPPSADVNIVWNKLEVKGKLARMDDRQAWIKADNMEVPVEFDAIPRDYLLQAMNLNDKDPKGLADKATALFSWGDIEQTGNSEEGRTRRRG
jgi:hypothetical protein